MVAIQLWDDLHDGGTHNGGLANLEPGKALKGQLFFANLNMQMPDDCVCVQESHAIPMSVLPFDPFLILATPLNGAMYSNLIFGSDGNPKCLGFSACSLQESILKTPTHHTLLGNSQLLFF